ncbi:MAG: hypothetical protein ACOCQD_01495, partial [archaeon]
MYPVSTDFLEAIQKNKREIFGKVNFGIVDVTAKEDINNISVTSEANTISDYNQIITEMRSHTYKLITGEKERTTLNGTFHFASTDELENNSMGYVSDNLSDSNGDFSSPPEITIDFDSAHTTKGFTIYFEEKTNSYATDLDISIYDDSDSLIKTVNFSNDSAVFGTEEELENFYKLVITINSWNKPQSRARIIEIDFGATLMFENDEVINMNVTNELTGDTSYLPIGEVEVNLDNTEKQFDILNPDGFGEYLQDEQYINPYVGISINGDYNDVEYMPLGTYFLNDFKINRGKRTVKLTGKSIIRLMEDYHYRQDSGVGSYSLGELAEDIFAEANIEYYNIDSELYNITTKGYSNRINCREAIRRVAEAGKANIYVDRDNVINLVVYDYDTLEEDDFIPRRLMTQSPEIKMAEIIKRIEVEYYKNN